MRVESDVRQAVCRPCRTERADMKAGAAGLPVGNHLAHERHLRPACLVCTARVVGYTCVAREHHSEALGVGMSKPTQGLGTC